MKIEFNIIIFPLILNILHSFTYLSKYTIAIPFEKRKLCLSVVRTYTYFFLAILCRIVIKKLSIHIRLSI